ncbi:glycoside hydrolase superfamily [Zopfochytrium polystomum]|nr:glycoside hydrolase superfamily [Zopfochytrium polystomum]
MGVRHAALHCLFWAKVFVAMVLSIGGLAYFSYKVLVLHLEASPPSTGATVNKPIQITNDSTSCDASKTGYSRLQLQTTGKIMLGWSLDWAVMTPRQAVEKLGFSAAIYNTFMEMNMNTNPPYDQNSLNWFGSEVGRVGGILEVTMAPTSPLDELADNVLDAFAKQLLDINSRYGVPVLLRWGHEMNSDWTTYGNRPIAYIKSFRRMTTFVRKYTNLTAMVWAPNVGIQAPFDDTTGTVHLPVSGPDFDALDTNHDGKIDYQDDPYTPYFPGADYVDWFGLSHYYYPFEQINEAVPPTYFADYLTASGPTAARSIGPGRFSANFTATHNFYQLFPATYNKPMLLPETGAPFLQDITIPNVDEVSIKMGWWDQVLSQDTVEKFPLMVAAANFEEQKFLNGHLRDWRLLNNTKVQEAFKARVTAFAEHLVTGPELVFGCDGSVKLR